MTISGYPFTHGQIKNFLTDGQNKGVKSKFSFCFIFETNSWIHPFVILLQGTDVFAHALQTELLNLDFNEKSNDLYKFAQSDELMIANAGM